MGKHILIFCSIYWFVLLPIVALWLCFTAGEISSFAKIKRVVLLILFWPFSAITFGFFVEPRFKKALLVGLALIPFFLGSIYYVIAPMIKTLKATLTQSTQGLNPTNLPQIDPNQLETLSKLTGPLQKQLGSLEGLDPQYKQILDQLLKQISQLGDVPEAVSIPTGE